MKILFAYLFFELVYKGWRGKLFATDIIYELKEMMTGLVKEFESDNQGAKYCFWTLTTVLILAFIIIAGCGIAGIVKSDNTSDIFAACVALSFLIPASLLFWLFNELCMSWVKRIRLKK